MRGLYQCWQTKQMTHPGHQGTFTSVAYGAVMGLTALRLEGVFCSICYHEQAWRHNQCTLPRLPLTDEERIIFLASNTPCRARNILYTPPQLSIATHVLPLPPFIYHLPLLRPTFLCANMQKSSHSYLLLMNYALANE